VRAIRESNEPATRLAGRYAVSETLIRRIRRNEIWVTRRPREATRLPAVMTLLLAGPRVSELCRLDESEVDLAARRVRIPRVKTDASERTVPMVPALHETLLAARAARETHGGPASQRAMARASILTTSGRGCSRLYRSVRTSCLPSATSP
jgi:integrase